MLSNHKLPKMSSNVNQVLNPTGGMMPNGGGMIDMFVNNIMLTKLMDSDYKLDIHNILKLIGISQIDFAKTTLGKGLEHAANLIKYYYMMLVAYIYKQYTLNKSPIPQPKQVPLIPNDFIIKNIIFDESFMKGLYYFALSDDCSCTVDDINYISKNRNDVIVLKKVHDIKFTHDDIMCEIDKNLYYLINTRTSHILKSCISIKDIQESYNMNGSEIDEIDENDYIPQNNKTHGIKYTDYLTSKQKKIFDIVKKKCFSECTDEYLDSIRATERKHISHANFGFMEIFKTLCSKYVEFESQLLDIVIVYILITHYNGNAFNKYFYDSIVTMNINPLDVGGMYADVDIEQYCGFNIFSRPTSDSGSYNSPKIINFNVLISPPVKYNIFARDKKLMGMVNSAFSRFTCSISGTTSVKSNDIDIKFKSMDENIVNSSMLKLVNSIKIYEQSNKAYGDQIGIYRVKYDKKTTETTEPNPAYPIWTHMMNRLGAADLEKIIQSVNNIPPKNIVTKSTVKTLKVDKINTIFKNLDKLILRKKDKNRLVKSLNLFKNKKKLLKSWGLRVKLNVMLHGLPGTGKTTTIQAIASYLGRDIYYVNLREVETNRELQEIFDYISDNENGIVVFEDIDCMTDVVLEREKSSSQRENSVTEVDLDDTSETDIDSMSRGSTNDIVDEIDDKLTLSYFLNLLDGILTRDNFSAICTTNYLKMLDSAFIRPGRFDVIIETKRCNEYQIKEIFNKFVKIDINDKSVEKLLTTKPTPAKLIFHCKYYIDDENITSKEIVDDFLAP